MERVKLEVQPRAEAGSRAVRRLRKQGLIPGVLYGHGKPAHLFSIDERALREAVSGDSGLHAVIDVTIAGQKTAHTVVVKDYQLDRVKHVVTHVDLQEVRLTEPIEAKVAVVFEGEAAGVKMGGILDVLTREVSVKALPTSMPDRLVLDVTDFEIGTVAHVGDLVAPEDVEILDSPDEAICTVLVPRKVVLTTEEEEAEAEEAAEEAAEEGAAEEGEEPEVIGERKAPGEGKAAREGGDAG